METNENLTPQGMAELNAAFNAGPGMALVDNADTADELLDGLAAIKREYRAAVLTGRGIKILREAADLCGIDSTDVGKKSAIAAIIGNF
jgi:hypothetical protein